MTCHVSRVVKTRQGRTVVIINTKRSLKVEDQKKKEEILENVATSRRCDWPSVQTTLMETFI